LPSTADKSQNRDGWREGTISEDWNGKRSSYLFWNIRRIFCKRSEDLMACDLDFPGGNLL
jgi:hypothetical protein